MRRLPALTVSLLLTLTVAFAQPSGPVQGNDVEILVSGQYKWERLLEDLQAARSSICLEYFRFTNDESGGAVRDVLLSKVREGVTVRLVVDNIIQGFMPKSFYGELVRAGAELRYFTNPNRLFVQLAPELDHRDHRKIVVIDGCLAYTGGMNLSDHYHYEWKDTHLRIEGPAAACLASLFDQTWNQLGETSSPLEALTPQAVSANSGDSSFCFHDKPVEFINNSPFYPAVLNLYIQVLHEAQTYAYFETPYLAPPPSLVEALKDAAARGVDVRILVPRKTDHTFSTATNQSFYKELLEDGVRIFEYLPRFKHAKTLIVDDRDSWFGSVNLDNRSFFIDYEIATHIPDAEVTRAYRAHYEALQQDAHEVTLEEVDAWPAGKRLRHHLVRILEKEM